jgi:hypothetical protein
MRFCHSVFVPSVAVLPLTMMLAVGCMPTFGESRRVSVDDDTREQVDSEESDDEPPFNLPFKTSGGNQVWTDVHIYHGWRIQKNVVLEHYRLLDPGDVRRAWGTREQCAARFEEIKKEEKLEPPKGKCVVVVHGLWRSRDAMAPFAELLDKEGHYHVVNFNYATTREYIGDHALNLASVIDGLENVDEINFVACSLGNLVVRRYLFEQEKKSKDGKLDPRFKRMVMIAPPNQGAQFARRFSGDAVLRATWGGIPGDEITEWEKLAAKLTTPPFEFGIIAGGIGADTIRNPLVDGDDDYLVAVEETKLAGARDFVVLPATHASIKRDPAALEYTLRFLKDGHFKADGKREPLER